MEKGAIINNGKGYYLKGMRWKGTVFLAGQNKTKEDTKTTNASLGATIGATRLTGINAGFSQGKEQVKEI